MEIIFWSSLFFILYTYILYAVFLKLILLFSSEKRVSYLDSELTVSILVACFNEQDFIDAKINNLLNLNYNSDKLHIVFITDGSTDKTVEVVTEYKNKHPNKISLYHSNERNGKQHAINRVMPFVDSDIVVFNDCNTIINNDSIVHLVKHFGDEKVGVVNGEKKIIVEAQDDAVSAGEGLYWKYESILKKIDSDFHTSVGSAGELFAVRRKLYSPVPNNISIEDFYLSMQIVLNGYGNIYEPKAYAKEYSSFDLKEEFKRKKRISAGAFRTILSLKSIYKWEHRKVLFLYMSHRVFRWTLAPISLVFLFISNLFLTGGIYQIFLVLQMLFYFLVLMGYLLRTNKTKIQIFFIPFYFIFMNVALFAGFLDFMQNRNHTTWEKSKRKLN